MEHLMTIHSIFKKILTAGIWGAVLSAVTLSLSLIRAASLMTNGSTTGETLASFAGIDVAQITRQSSENISISVLPDFWWLVISCSSVTLVTIFVYHGLIKSRPTSL